MIGVLTVGAIVSAVWRGRFRRIAGRVCRATGELGVHTLRCWVGSIKANGATSAQSPAGLSIARRVKAPAEINLSSCLSLGRKL